MDSFSAAASQNISLCVRLLLATLYGSLIGLERGSHGQSAGVRTFSLVCLGACLSMITGETLYEHYLSGDPARLAAQVISGIGFLGAGTIFVTGRNYVRGLTTAAGLWVTACLGIAVGTGHLLISLVAFALIFFVMTALTRLSHRTDDKAQVMSLYMEVDPENGIREIYRFAESHGLSISSMEREGRQALHGEDTVIAVTFKIGKNQSHASMIRQMYESTAFHYIEEIR